MNGTPPEPPAGTAVAISDLTVILNGIAILDRVTAMIPEKGCTAVVGPNGAGKTTLFLALLGQIPHRGAIRFPAWPARPRFGYVPQRLELDPGLPITAGEFLRLSRGPLPLWLPSRRAERNRAESLLSLVGLEHCRDRRVGELSGGELQRLLVALALGRNPEILLLDEATSAADAGNREELWRLLDRLRREMGFVQIMISHDFPSVTAYADRLICLNHRVLAEGDAADFRANGGLASIFPGPASPAPAPLRESCHA